MNEQYPDGNEPDYLSTAGNDAPTSVVWDYPQQDKLTPEIPAGDNDVGEVAEQPVVTDAVDDSAGPTEESQETHTIEYLGRVAKEAGVFAHAWIAGNEIDSGKRSGTSGFYNVYNAPEMNFSLEISAGNRTPDNIKRNMIERGITEHVRVVPSRRTLGSLKPDSRHREKPTTFIHYEVTTDTREGISSKAREYQVAYREAGARAESLYVIMALPSDVVEDFLGKAQDDPKLFRELVDTAMRQEIGMSESWDGVHEDKHYVPATRPPYDAWKEINGGINRIALTNLYVDRKPKTVEF